jgi:DedD protein
MDHELKQRLIGAVVVTALAAIFIPMLFDDPVDTSGKTVKELTIPPEPVGATPEISQKLPANKAQVLNRPDIELNASEINEDATGEASMLDGANGGKTGKQGITVNGKGSDAEVDMYEPGDEFSAEQTEGTGLDTGVVGEVGHPEIRKNKTTTDETEKEAKQNSAIPTNQSVSKPEFEGKIKPKPLVTEKAKTITKNQEGTNKKSSSKLVRYSIQAGSFSKRENAQALVEKLRKQGMPASIVAKGELYRVKVGPSLDKVKAKEMKAKLDRQNIKGLLISE